jgi:hypothetical protein
MNQLSWRRRYAPGGLGFWRAMGRSYGLLFAALTGLFIGVYAAVPHMSLLIVTLPAAVLMSCVVHEAGHLVAVRHSDTPSFLLSSFGYAAVTYVQPSRRWSRLIAAAGPCMAAAVYITAALYISPILLKCIAVSTALLHLGALLPWFADGKTLWRTL